IKIHLSNNQLLIDSLTDFRDSVRDICAETGSANLRIYHGRFFFNEERLNFNPALSTIMAKMVDFLQDREIQGLRFHADGSLSDEDIITFVNLLGQADQHKDPVDWFSNQLEVYGFKWVQVMTDKDFKAPEMGEGLQSLAQNTYSYAMSSMARKTYSNALTSIISMTGKLTSRQRVGIQKSKRVIQSLIEMLTEDESILLGMSTIRNYDDYTYTHSVNVAMLSMCLGKRIGLSREAIGQLGLCGLFHDLGKVDVPISLIQKPGHLEDAEYEVVKEHSLNSVRQILRLHAEYTLKCKLIVPPFEHHLGVNLSGYPRTERRKPLNLFSRILAVADHYDAMTSSRSYRPAPIRPDMALKMMVARAGVTLDPVILKVFIEMIGIYPVGTLVLLDTRELGLVMETPENADYKRPLVRLLLRDGEGGLLKGELIDLAECDEQTGAFKRNITRCFPPSDYGIQASLFLI
ncbi:MAG: HD domain-containing protein, partial [Candidatus Adiutrix sp.]|nr:HD domain-containing protein [Candidatus Adiutrix sp.]